MESYKTIEAFFIILLVMAFADFISQRTKGYISMLLTATVIFIVMFTFGINKQLFQLASFSETSRTIASACAYVKFSWGFEPMTSTTGSHLPSSKLT